MIVVIGEGQFKAAVKEAIVGVEEDFNTANTTAASLYTNTYFPGQLIYQNPAPFFSITPQSPTNEQWLNSRIEEIRCKL